MEENAKIAAQKSGRLSFYVVNAIADGCTPTLSGRFFYVINRRKAKKRYSFQVSSKKCIIFAPRKIN